jgi:hypothetical protein
MSKRICCEISTKGEIGKLRAFSTSIKVPGCRIGGPTVFARSISAARKKAKSHHESLQPLTIQGELGFEVDVDGNVLTAAFRADDRVRMKDIDAFLELHRAVAAGKIKAKERVA